MGADTSRRQIIDDMPQNHRTGSWAERKGEESIILIRVKLEASMSPWNRGKKNIERKYQSLTAAAKAKAKCTNKSMAFME